MGGSSGSDLALEVSVLGPLEVRRDGVRCDVPGRRERALLVALALDAGRTVSVDRLVALLWGDDPPRTAAKTLQGYVSRLRSALGGERDLIVRREDGYVLALAPEQVDALCFERLVTAARAAHREGGTGSAVTTLREAIALWRADEPAAVGDTPAAQALTASLAGARLAAQEERIAAELSLGHHAELVGELEELTERHPYRERLWGQLVLALYRSGRQAAALDGYRRLQARLGDELGLDPSPELQDLERRILAQATELAAPPAPSPPTNLPAETATFVGREQEIDRLLMLLEGGRLATLVGFGGVGKTRLALRVADLLRDRFPGGAWWCELAPVRGAGAVPRAVASTLGIRPEGDEPVADVLVAAVASRRLLLVLDNCEHEIAAVRGLVARLLRSCPNLTVLATSREPLGIAGERLLEVSPLPVAGSTEATAPAVRLFLDRARAVDPVFDPSGEEAGAVAEICRRLDGLPLAIELAAARIRALAPTDIVGRLDRRFRLLDARQGQAGRHPSLRAAIDWSHDLLGATERAVFRRLSVFPGAFTLDAAEAVCAAGKVGATDVASLVAALVDRSMLVAVRTGGSLRYRMLETLRVYAGERLAAAGEVEAARRAHATFFTDMAETLGRALTGPEEPGAVRTLDAAFNDLRQAHAWAVDSGEADLALRLPVALYWFAFWGLRADVFEWAETAGRTFDDGDAALVAEALGAAAVGATFRGDTDEARRLAEQARALGERAGRGGSLFALFANVRMHLREGDVPRLTRLTDELEVLDSRVGDGFMTEVVGALRYAALAYSGKRREAFSVLQDWLAARDRPACPSLRAWRLYAYGEALGELNPDDAVVALREAVAIARQVDNHFIEGIASVTLSSLAGRFGDPTEALSSFEEAISLWEARGAWTHQWITLRNLVELLGRIGRIEDAVTLHRAGVSSRSASPVFGEQGVRLANLMDRARERLAPAALEAARRRGEGMSDDEAVAFAHATIRETDAADLVSQAPLRS